MIISLCAARSMGAASVGPDDRQHGQRTHALDAVNKNALDVCRCGWTGVKNGIMAFAKLGSLISMVKIDDDVAGIEQHDQVHHASALPPSLLCP